MIKFNKLKNLSQIKSGLKLKYFKRDDEDGIIVSTMHRGNHVKIELKNGEDVEIRNFYLKEENKDCYYLTNRYESEFYWLIENRRFQMINYEFLKN